MELTESEVSAVVRPYVEKSSIKGITFSLDDYMERSPFAWKIGVRPSRYPRHRYVIHEELAQLSEDVAEGEGLNVFVVGVP